MDSIRAIRVRSSKTESLTGTLDAFPHLLDISHVAFVRRPITRPFLFLPALIPHLSIYVNGQNDLSSERSCSSLINCNWLITPSRVSLEPGYINSRTIYYLPSLYVYQRLFLILLFINRASTT